MSSSQRTILITTSISGYTESLSSASHEKKTNKTLEKTERLGKDCFSRIRESSYTLPTFSLLLGAKVIVVLTLATTLPIWGVIAIGAASIALPIIIKTVAYYADRHKKLDALTKRISEGGNENLKLASEFLKNHGLLTLENLKALAKSPENAMSLAKAFYSVRHAFPHMLFNVTLTDETRNIILKSPENAEQLGRAIAYLILKHILTAENCKAILESPENAEQIAEAIIDLFRDGILTDENCNILQRNPGNARYLAKALGFCSALILEDETRNTIQLHLASPENAKHLAKAIISLKYTGILTAKNCNELIRGNGAYAKAIAHHLIKMPLDTLDDIVLCKKIFDLSVTNPYNLYEHKQFAMYVERRYKISNIKILTRNEYQKRFDALIEAVSSSIRRTAIFLALRDNPLVNNTDHLIKLITDEFFVPNP